MSTPHQVSRSLLWVVLCGALFLAGCARPAPPSASQELHLVVVHSNDTHSYLAGRDKYGNACLASAECVGGLPRMATAIQAIKDAKDAKARGDNVLVLDAGDQFQGTLFYTAGKWPMLADIDTLMPYDAMTLGNHEFDDGCEDAASFVKALSFPVVAANLNPQPGCPLQGAPYRPWIIREVRGVKVAVVGLANPDVCTLAAACPQTHFTDSAATLRKAVADLERQGVRHIVALTHLGLPEDRALARSVDGVDIIVGGHTHTYLGEGSKDGPYPVVEYAPSGQPVLVVTAAYAAEYLGELEVTFDASGVPRQWQGAARRLDASVTPDAAVEAKVAAHARELERFRAVPLGRNDLEYADGMEACRRGECLGGLVVADAMLEAGRPYGAEIAILNGGSLRAPLKRGELTRGDVLSVLPFGNALVLRQYSGEQLLAALEHGVAGEGGVGPRLLHVAGLRYGFDPTQPPGRRLQWATHADAHGAQRAVDKTGQYTVILSTFLAKGGDGYTMLPQGQTVTSPEPLDADVLGAYLQAHSPLTMPKVGRINRVAP